MGKLTVLCGPMFAGKTEALITQALKTPRRRILKPTTDTRHGDSHLLSHGGISISAEWIDPDLERLELPASQTIQTRGGVVEQHWGPDLFIDEAQFLTPAAVERIRQLGQKGLNITLAGLDLTAQAKPFGVMAEFLCLADEVVKLTGACASCGRPSTRTRCKITQKDVVLIGGSEAYEPLCQGCFTKA